MVQHSPAPRGRLAISEAGCETLREVEPQALGLTYWYDAPPDGDPVDLLVRFEGRRLEGPDSSLPIQFAVETHVRRVIPGSGRAAVTTRVQRLAPGSYEVRAAEKTPTRTAATPPASGRTGYSPVVKVSGPHVVLGAWPALVLLGTLVALLLQNRLAEGSGLPTGRLLALTGLACLLGTGSAKAYYLMTHRGQKSDVPMTGMSVQGFVLGAVGTLILGSLALDLALGDVLDITAPGLLLGMTIGRFGCLLGGCCAGRPTASRWGIRSSDRRLLTCRIPVQLMEGAVAAAAAGLALLLLALGRDEPAGAVFTGAVALYVLGRQLLFPLRDLPRTTRHGRVGMIGLSGSLAIGAAAVLL